MSAQKESQPSTSQSTSKTEQSSQGEQSSRQSSLARRGSVFPSVPSLLLDPLGFFDDSPFSLLRRMHQEMNRAFSPGSGAQGDNVNPVWIPPIEVAYRDGNLVVSAELPGLKDEDISVAIQDNAIVIQGERQVQHEEEEGEVHRTEIRYGRFYRAIPLPEGAKTEQARAEFSDGVLRISVPVPQQQSNVRQIPIETSGSSQASSSTTQQKPVSTETSAEKKAA